MDDMMHARASALANSQTRPPTLLASYEVDLAKKLPVLTMDPSVP